MFTVKVMKDGGYTVYECKTYGVTWGKDGKASVFLNPGNGENVNIVGIEGTAYIQNAMGKTVDKISVLATAIQDPALPKPRIKSTDNMYLTNPVWGYHEAR